MASNRLSINKKDKPFSPKKRISTEIPAGNAVSTEEANKDGKAAGKNRLTYNVLVQIMTAYSLFLSAAKY